jgi:hypothetical protein
LLLKQVAGVKNLACRNRLRKGLHDGDSLHVFSPRFCITSFANRGFNGMGASPDFDRVYPRTRDGQHQRGCVAEVALESDRAGAVRQLRIQGVQFEIDVTELPLGIFQTLFELRKRKSSRAAIWT